MRDDKLHTDVARSRFRSQNAKSTSCSERFWGQRCQKSARRFVAKHISKWKVQKLRVSDHSWKLSYWKSERRCGAKHISKSKVLKTDGLGPLVEVRMWFCVAGARDSVPCQKCSSFKNLLHCQLQKLRMSRRLAAFWMLSSIKIEEVSPKSFVF